MTTNPMRAPWTQLKSHGLAHSASVEHTFREILLQNPLTQVPAQALSLVHDDELSFEVQLPVTYAVTACDMPIGFFAEAGDSVTVGKAQAEPANAPDGLNALSTRNAVSNEARTVNLLSDPVRFIGFPRNKGLWTRSRMG